MTLSFESRFLICALYCSEPRIYAATFISYNVLCAKSADPACEMTLYSRFMCHGIPFISHPFHHKVIHRFKQMDSRAQRSFDLARDVVW